MLRPALLQVLEPGLELAQGRRVGREQGQVPPALVRVRVRVRVLVQVLGLGLGLGQRTTSPHPQVATTPSAAKLEMPTTTQEVPTKKLPVRAGRRLPVLGTRTKSRD